MLAHSGDPPVGELGAVDHVLDTQFLQVVVQLRDHADEPVARPGYWAIPIAAALLLVAYRRRDDAGTIAARVIPLDRSGASRELDVSSRSAADASSRRHRAGGDAGRMARCMRMACPAPVRLAAGVGTSRRPRRWLGYARRLDDRAARSCQPARDLEAAPGIHRRSRLGAAGPTCGEAAPQPRCTRAVAVLRLRRSLHHARSSSARGRLQPGSAGLRAAWVCRWPALVPAGLLRG